MPSMGIYSYELYKFYNVNAIIRLGSCGGYTSKLKLSDIVLVDNSYTEGNFALALNNNDCHYVGASDYLNNVIQNTANSLNVSINKANILCGEVFDNYMTDMNKMRNRLPEEYNISGAEMEAFALFYNAKLLNKNAACLLTVVDSYFYKEHCSADDRQNSLNTMIKLGLESAVNIES